MEELIKVDENAVLTEEDIEFIHKYDEIKKRYKVWEDSKKEMFYAFLESKGTDSYTIGDTTIYKTRPYTKKQVDIQSLKDDGIYDLYTKDVEVSGSVRIKIDYEND